MLVAHSLSLPHFSVRPFGAALLVLLPPRLASACSHSSGVVAAGEVEVVVEAVEVGVTKEEVVAAGVGSEAAEGEAVEAEEEEELAAAAGEELEVAGEAAEEAALALILVAPSLMVVSLPSTCLATVPCATRLRSARPSPRP